MSLHPEACPTIPEETLRVARASFPKGGRYMRLRDELGPVFDDTRFAGLFPARGRPAEAPWRLALVTLFQFAEGLPDRQAAEAVRGRIDWKYILALPLADPGFDSTVLSEFRSRLVEGRAEQVLLDAVLTLARERNLLSAGGRQRTDSTHVLAAVRALNRLECVIETMRHALESLAVVAPDWLQAHAQPDLSAMGTVPSTIVWRRAQPVGRSVPGLSDKMAMHFWLRHSIRQRRAGCSKCLPSRPCGASGCSSSILRRRA